MPSLPTRRLTGWRCQAWSLLLFSALLRGLVPHAALAAVLDDGSPRLSWCAPGAGGPSQPVDLAATLAAHAQCACATAGDAWVSGPAMPVPDRPQSDAVLIVAGIEARFAPRYRGSQARGPPSQLD